jgi:hypothetical protein
VRRWGHKRQPSVIAITAFPSRARTQERVSGFSNESSVCFAPPQDHLLRGFDRMPCSLLGAEYLIAKGVLIVDRSGSIDRVRPTSTA